ncbi:hypothetical protein L195_g061953, partial [Trifolium pratense]
AALLRHGATFRACPDLLIVHPAPQRPFPAPQRHWQSGKLVQMILIVPWRDWQNEKLLKRLGLRPDAIYLRHGVTVRMEPLDFCTVIAPWRPKLRPGAI